LIKKRIFEDKNYSAIWHDGKTIRIALDPKKPILELDYPEFYDVSINNFCTANCPWCYQDAKASGVQYDDILNKVRDYFGPMSENERPFQIALGSAGEPTTHPDFIHLLSVFKSMGIEPNYTTNGMNITKEIVNATKKHCGGVAVSCHPHLLPHWTRAAYMFLEERIKLNFHIIISDRNSIDYFKHIYYEWYNKIDYFVLLPYVAQGRAESRDIDWEYLVRSLPNNTRQIAFGAGFYQYLLRNDHNINVSLYEPEIMSKFLDLKDMSLYKSSFDLTKVN